MNAHVRRLRLVAVTALACAASRAGGTAAKSRPHRRAQAAGVELALPGVEYKYSVHTTRLYLSRATAGRVQYSEALVEHVAR